MFLLKNKKLISSRLAAGVLLTLACISLSQAEPVVAESSEAKIQNHAELLKSIAQRAKIQKELQKKREIQFKQHVDQQRTLLARARKKKAQLESEYNTLVTTFQQQEEQIKDLTESLTLQTGSLGEISGTIKEAVLGYKARQNTTPLAPLDSSSPLKLEQLEDSGELPAMSQVRGLWELNLTELVNTGNRSFTQTASEADETGKIKKVEIESFGPFLFFDKDTKKLAAWNSDTKMFEVPMAQPDISPRYSGPDGLVYHTVDPTFGGLLLAESSRLSWYGRLQQGGVIALIIIAVGLTGLLIGVVRGTALLFEKRRVFKQVQALETANPDNCLGRVLMCTENTLLSFEELEYKLEEQIVKERIKLEKGVSFIKLCASVAPLLGLLGTVTGMIATFQSITVHGTSDPSLLAGGISQALVTTKVGLIVAIPLLFIHGLVKSPLQHVLNVLEGQAYGMLARRKELPAPQKPKAYSVAS